MYLTKYRISSVNDDTNLNRSGGIHVISVAWSASFIAHAIRASWSLGCPPNLQLPSISANTEATGPSRMEPLQVYANEIDEAGLGRVIGCPTNDGHRILTADDKHRVMNNIIKLTQQSNPESQMQTLYVGDSPTDLRCILDADIGICMRDDPLTSEQLQLQQALARINVSTNRVTSLANQSRNKSDGKTIWFAFDFVEISEALSSVEFDTSE